ncbi:MAG TPA: carbohydrate ABC transporter permease [Clostridia bacterium]|jgi:ABC-type glycerol-3-phosphate transport system permease component|nr:carbohydrate ABC transporter permease [Clostridia bacterium]HPY43948.1 carbohydrate ABC transporter permease [Clostridia bacterium]HQA97465.1 carbohydrate ABC transporter permease [Clostridia bacterium]HQO54963.1 carbohydrate ABC transporter permease [Clostridia bacterium]HUM60008.1 carbohydrate ABC transporter permease [Clostridia bacterium]
MAKAEKEKLTRNQRKIARIRRKAERAQRKGKPRTRFGKALTKGRSNRTVRGSIALLINLFLFALLMVFPVVFLVSNAFKPINELFIFPPKLFVINPTLDNFTDLFDLLSNSLVPFTRYLFNTLLIVLLGSIGHILLSSMAAFPLAKFRFPGAKTLSNIVTLSLMFTAAVTAVPNYIIMSRLGLVDTYWAIILPAFSMSLGLFLMKNFMEQVPDALVDAAQIDGATYFTMLWRIVMPAVKPAWITLFIVSFQTLWGNTAGNFIYTESMKPLPAMLSQIAGSGVARAGVVAATSLIMFIVPVVVFTVSQSNVLETMSTSGIKE